MPTGLDAVEITVDINLQQVSRMVSRSTCFSRYDAFKTKLAEVEFTDEHIDYPQRVSVRHIVIQALWAGTNNNKGLGVFVKNDMSLTPLNLKLGRLQLFLPCTVGEITLLAAWTKGGGWVASVQVHWPALQVAPATQGSHQKAPLDGHRRPQQ